MVADKPLWQCPAEQVLQPVSPECQSQGRSEVNPLDLVCEGSPICEEAPAEGKRRVSPGLQGLRKGL